MGLRRLFLAGACAAVAVGIVAWPLLSETLAVDARFVAGGAADGACGLAEAAFVALGDLVLVVSYVHCLILSGQTTGGKYIFRVKFSF